MSISRETEVRILVAATIVIIAVILIVFFDTSPPLPKGPGTAPATSEVGTIPRKGPPYSNCQEARADGRSNIPRGDPAYNPALDRDNDGIACNR